MNEIIIKLTDDEVVNILAQVDELLKNNKIKVPALFKNNVFDISDIKNVDSEFLNSYFTGYTAIEFMKWIKKNIGYYNDFITKDGANREDKIAKCYIADVPIITSADFLMKMLQKRKSRNAYITVTFNKNNENLCDKFTYDKIRDTFTNNKYYTHVFNLLSQIPNEFTLHITIEGDSIKMEIEGLENLQIYLASSLMNSDIYYEDYSSAGYENSYAMKVMKYHDEDYIWIYKSTIQTNYEEIQSMMECVMFACHFPINILRHSIVPMYSIKSIYVNEEVKINGLISNGNRSIIIPNELKFKLPKKNDENNIPQNNNMPSFPKYNSKQIQQDLTPTKYGGKINK